MMTSSNGKHFPRYWPFVRGIHRSPMNSPHKGQWRGALMFSLISARINGWVNNGEAGDLRRHRAHYGIIVMSPTYCAGTKSIAIDLFTMADRMGIGFDSESDTYNNHQFFVVTQWTLAWLRHSTCSTKYHTSYEIFITVYFHSWTLYKPIIGRIIACLWYFSFTQYHPITGFDAEARWTPIYTSQSIVFSYGGRGGPSAATYRPFPASCTRAMDGSLGNTILTSLIG